MTNAGPKLRLDALVRDRHRLSWSKARDWIASGKVWLDGAAVTDPGHAVAPDAAIELRMNVPRAAAPLARAKPGAASRPGALAEDRIVHCDTQLVVVDKPAGLSTVPHAGDGREARGRTSDSLEEQVNRHLGGRPVEVVHRLDRETSGLVVFARTSEAARGLANQFRFHSVRRRYFALAHGSARNQTIRTLLVEDRGDGRRGSVPEGARHLAGGAKEAITHVRSIRSLAGFSLIECELETGRTHQIRLHLSELGHPLLGEKLYVRDDLPAPTAAPRVMLHAAELGLSHPIREAPLRWTRLPPPDFIEMIGPDALTALVSRLSSPGA